MKWLVSTNRVAVNTSGPFLHRYEQIAAQLSLAGWPCSGGGGYPTSCNVFAVTSRNYHETVTFVSKVSCIAEIIMKQLLLSAKFNV